LSKIDVKVDLPTFEVVLVRSRKPIPDSDIYRMKQIGEFYADKTFMNHAEHPEIFQTRGSGSPPVRDGFLGHFRAVVINATFYNQTSNEYCAKHCICGMMVAIPADDRITEKVISI
jgi:hypothetical protein